MSLIIRAGTGDPHQSTAVVVAPVHAAPDLPRDSNARAIQKISALGEMTGGIAHDFRNVLAVVASGLRIAEDNAGDPTKLMAALAAVQDGVDRGMRMISRLLAFARQQELKSGPEDVNALLRKLEMFLKYGAGSGIRLVLELAPDLPKCLVDPPQFNAAILNLVVNARDAMSDAGTIKIKTTAVVDETHGCYVRVSVSDDGSGMSAEITRKIFDPYFTTKGDNGTGLGVPQVQALMRQVGGYVRVESKMGHGTSFDLFFPVHEEPLPALDGWRQLDRWADEGGAIAAGKAPSAMGLNEGGSTCSLS